MTYRSIFRSGLFDGQVGIVTGGGTGIGRCIAHELASLGATVVLASRTEEKLSSTADEIRADGGRADHVVTNIRDEEQVRALMRVVLERHRRIDFVVNNGGGQFISGAENISLKGFKAVVETNLTGTFLMCREAMLQWMGEHGGGIVNIVADMWRGMPMMAHSGAARAGVVNLTKTLALEWSPHRIRVNAVAPGMVLSSGLKNYPEPVQQAMKSLPEEAVPLRRFGTESEVSAAVVFLLSEAAAYITGETIAVDGASSLYRQPFQLPAGEPTHPFAGFHRAADVPSALSEDRP
jgi:citronellol/citronellal dehydrogenase